MMFSPCCEGGRRRDAVRRSGERRREATGGVPTAGVPARSRKKEDQVECQRFYLKLVFLILKIEFLSAVQFSMFLFLFCVLMSENSILHSHFFIRDISPCRVKKSKRATTHHQCPGALSALDIHTMMPYQCFQAL
jgi:hypothetical protein